MVFTLSQMCGVRRRYRIALRTAMLVLIINVVCFGQSNNGPAPSATPEDKPLKADERAELLKLIKSLQERVEKLEAAQAPLQNNGAAVEPAATSTPVDPEPSAESTESPAPAAEAPKQDDDDNKFDGRYTPNLGFKVVNTEYGDMNISIYTYVRYLLKVYPRFPARTTCAPCPWLAFEVHA